MRTFTYHQWNRLSLDGKNQYCNIKIIYKGLRYDNTPCDCLDCSLLDICGNIPCYGYNKGWHLSKNQNDIINGDCVEAELKENVERTETVEIPSCIFCKIGKNGDCAFGDLRGTTSCQEQLVKLLKKE